MSVINKYHLPYIQMRPIQDFYRKEKIAFSSYTIDGLINNINNLLEKGELSADLVIRNLDLWIYQGRKKIVFRYLDSDILRNLRKYETFKTLVEGKMEKSDEITDISKLRPDVSEKNHFIDVKYNFDNEGYITEAVFLFIKIVKYIKTDGAVHTNKPMALPVHVTIDFENDEIYSRINAKTNIYDLEGNVKLYDADIAVNLLEYLLIKLGLNSQISTSDKDLLNKAIFKTHEIITKLPEEIEGAIKTISLDSTEFIKSAGIKLEIDLSENSLEELEDSINNLFIKELIKRYEDEEEDIFIKDNFAFSTSITASSRHLTKLRQTSPGKKPIHAVPEYQNVRSVLDETGTIDKNTVHWRSIIKKDTYFRSKLFIHDKGYGIISFEEYVYEEEINNVFSKIRKSKPTRII